MLAQRGPVWAFTMATANGHSRATSVARALAWTGPSGGWCSRSLPVVATQVTHPRSAARNLDRLEHNPALDSEVLNHHPSLSLARDQSLKFGRSTLSPLMAIVEDGVHLHQINHASELRAEGQPRS